jgi:hypothetical protein
MLRQRIERGMRGNRGRSPGRNVIGAEAAGHRHEDSRIAGDGACVVRHQSGDGFGGVRIDQQDAQIVSLSQSRPRRGTSEECLPSSLPAGKLPGPVRFVSAKPRFGRLNHVQTAALQPAKPK